MRLTLGIGKENARRNQTFFSFYSQYFLIACWKSSPFSSKFFQLL